MAPGDAEQGVGAVVGDPGALFGDDEGAGAPGGDLLERGYHVVAGLVVGDQGHHREAGLQKGDGAVLELPGGQGLGVEVGHLGDLERALGGDGGRQAAADVVDVVGAVDHPGQVHHLVLAGQDVGHPVGERHELAHHPTALVLGHRPALAAEPQGHQYEHHRLSCEDLGGGDGLLRAGVGIDPEAGLPGDGLAYPVDDGEQGVALLPRPREHVEGVHGLAGLADRQYGGVRWEPLGAGLGGGQGLDGLEAAVLLEELDAVVRRVTRGAAGHGPQVFFREQLVRPGVQAAELGRPPAEQQASAVVQGVEDRCRLGMDLPAHDVFALECVFLEHVLAGQLHRVVLATLDRVGAHGQHVAVLEHDHPAGELQEGVLEGGHEHLAVALAHQQGAAVAGHHELVRVVVRRDHQAPGALQLADRDPDRLLQGPLGRGVHGPPDQVSDQLAVGLRAHPLTLAPQGLADLRLVLDDAVVGDPDPAPPVGVGVGVGNGDRAVSCPAGVGQPQVRAPEAADVRVLRQLPGRRCAALGHQLDRLHPVAVGHRQSGRVVAALLQLFQSGYEDVDRVAMPDVSDDAAHDLRAPFSLP